MPAGPRGRLAQAVQLSGPTKVLLRATCNSLDRPWPTVRCCWFGTPAEVVHAACSACFGLGEAEVLEAARLERDWAATNLSQ
jgi:hypothetical protein